jgi:fructose-1,6-bisphosphatase/inositol monophosphatase family enzyme
MPSHHLDIDQVTRLIHQVAREVVVPRFGALGAADIQAKPSAEDMHDLVTIVDTEAEERLAAGLRAIADVPVIGEESCHRRPELLSLVKGSGPLWIVDPLDGTRNFAVGHDAFGIMVSFAVDGQTQAGWVHLPIRRETYVAETGAGAFVDGVRVQTPRVPAPGLVRGSLFVRFMPEDVRSAVIGRTTGLFRDVSESKCAAVEYTDVLKGEKEFLIYYRLLPWDHSAPALILTEGGGLVAHLDGRPYTVRSDRQVTVVAQNNAVMNQVRSWLAAGPLPGQPARD